MEFISLLDYLLLPVFLVIVFVVAYFVRERLYPAGHPWRFYFMAGLSAKVAGAIFIGLIYQYYYGGGDTANYHFHAEVINSALNESISKWLNLILRIPAWYDGSYSEYISRMYWYESAPEYAVASITALFGVVTFNTYLPIAVLYGGISFTGVWALFRTFATKYPAYTKYIAVCALFIPSTVMWGSGIFKDTICMFGLGWLTYGSFRMMVQRDLSPRNIVLTVISFLLIAIIKVYILLAFVPALVMWIMFTYSHLIRNSGVRLVMKTLVIAVCAFGLLMFSQRFAIQLGKYSLANVAQTSYLTNTYISGVSGDEGASYSLGSFDPSIAGMLKKFPLAVNVALFRPYLWETTKAIQFLNALEAMIFLWVTLKVLLFVGVRRIWRVVSDDPTIQFCLIFTVIFAFAVGLSSGNFGALSRYRIPCLPFFALSLVLIYYKVRPVNENILSLRR